MRAMRRIAMLVAGTCLIGLVLALPATAQEQPAHQEVATVDLRLQIPGNADIPPQLIATVRDGEGNAMPGIIVEFNREMEFLGTKRMALLGSAITDVGGRARLVVLPRQEQAMVIASVPGSDVSAIIDATFPTERVDVFFDPEHEHGLLAPVRNFMPPLITGVVALLWVFVIGLVASTMRRIRQLGEREGGQLA